MTLPEKLCMAGGIILLLTIVELIRKRRLREEYSLLWIAAALVIIVLPLERNVLHAVSLAIGIFYPPILLALVAGFFGMMLAIHYSLVLSRLSGENRLLAQDVALLRLEVEELKRQVPRPS